MQIACSDNGRNAGAGDSQLLVVGDCDGLGSAGAGGNHSLGSIVLVTVVVLKVSMKVTISMAVVVSVVSMVSALAVGTGCR